MMNFVNYFVKKPYLIKRIFILLIIIICGVAYCVSRYGVSENGAGEYGSLLDNDYSVSQSVSGDDIASAEQKADKEEYYVYVCGYVNKPDVYKCREGARIYEVIELAGGFSDKADREYLNLVEIVEDGQRIYVPSEEEVLSAQSEGGIGSILGSEKVNINTAGAEQLMTLPGIGEARAQDIISYRNANGRFEQIEDIMKVGGIKNASYEKIKDLIKV